MQTINFNSQIYIDHTSGDCNSDCPYCIMEEELIDIYDFNDERNGKVAKVGRSERNIRKI